MNERMRILIAYDGSSCADEALDDLRRAGLPREAEALVLSITEVWLPLPSTFESSAVAAMADAVPLSSGVSAQMARTNLEPTVRDDIEIKNLAEAASERLRQYFPEWIIETGFLRGSPARCVVTKAREWRADLIIVGSHGRSEANRFALGSVAQKVTNEAVCSVRVARGRAWKSGAPERILIALDGSSVSQAAVEAAARRMWMMGSEVRLVVVQDSKKALLDKQLIENKPEEQLWMREFVDRAGERLQRADLAVTELIEAGDPKQIIVAAAEEWGADYIFIGAGGGAMAATAAAAADNRENTLLGSVSTAVVARAHCTVEVVRG